MDAKKELRNLLAELCVDLGICLPPGENERIIAIRCINAEAFAKMVLRTEGLDPEVNVELFRQVKRRFTDKFGAEISDGGEA